MSGEQQQDVKGGSSSNTEEEQKNPAAADAKSSEQKQTRKFVPTITIDVNSLNAYSGVVPSEAVACSLLARAKRDAQPDPYPCLVAETKLRKPAAAADPTVPRKVLPLMNPSGKPLLPEPEQPGGAAAGCIHCKAAAATCCAHPCRCFLYCPTCAQLAQPEECPGCGVDIRMYIFCK